MSSSQQLCPSALQLQQKCLCSQQLGLAAQDSSSSTWTEEDLGPAGRLTGPCPAGPGRLPQILWILRVSCTPANGSQPTYRCVHGSSSAAPDLLKLPMQHCPNTACTALHAQYQGSV